MSASRREEQNMDKDLTKERCLADNERYADLINGTVFQGKQLLHADDLQDMDSQVWSINRLFKRRKYRQRYRDLIKKAAFGVNFIVIGVENQEEVHYLMPLRSMGYDVAEYERQADVISRSLRRKGKLTRAEFLSGFTGKSRLYPCLTLILFFGENWDCGRDLHSLLDFTDIPCELRTMVNNYTINLVEIRKLENTAVFQTDLKQIFDFIRCSKDKEKLKQLVENDAAYQDMDEDAYDMAAAYTNAEELIAVKKYHNKEGRINMCEALTALLEDSRQEGREEGREEGRKEGREEGLKSGEEQFAKLAYILIESGRLNDLERAVIDREYRAKLYQEI